MIKRWNHLAGLPLLKESSEWYDDKHETLADRKHSDALDAEEAAPSQEDMDIMFDQISDEIEDMGSTVAEQGIADMWLDENEYLYRGIYIDTRPHEGGKVKISWPGWGDAQQRGDLGW